jgi:hypothetical protein
MEINLEIGQELTFAAYYMACGDIQQTAGKDGLVIKKGNITKLKNGLVFYKIEGETGERKVKTLTLNLMRDFGTSIYGIYIEEKTEQEFKILIKNKLVKRLEQSNLILASL